MTSYEVVCGLQNDSNLKSVFLLLVLTSHYRSRGHFPILFYFILFFEYIHTRFCHHFPKHHTLKMWQHQRITNQCDGGGSGGCGGGPVKGVASFPVEYSS